MGADQDRVEDDRAARRSADMSSAIGLHHAMEAAQSDHEHGPVAAPERPSAEPTEPAPEVEPTEPAPEVDDGSIESIRARLAARGLLVQRPSVIVPREPRPERSVVLHDVLAEAEGDHHPNAVPEDDWDIPSDGGDLVFVRCPQCRGTQQTPVDVTRFRCVTCERAWRWAVCESCDTVGFTVERQESWRCGCGYFTRSWWRTDVAPREALVVVARRRDLAAQAARQEVREGMRRRRWKIILGAVVGLLAVLVFVGVVRAGETTAATGTQEACRQFGQLRSALGSGTLDNAQLQQRLTDLDLAAETASTPVREAADELKAVGRPSKAAFLIAQTKLADACVPSDSKR
ncbi:MAG TPA: hypothetical protein VM143_09795 [Acidimicrobiales bacterium]|nr:hypothetical protein [Acidimicrobiales bacterium]